MNCFTASSIATEPMTEYMMLMSVQALQYLCLSSTTWPLSCLTDSVGGFKTGLDDTDNCCSTDSVGGFKTGLDLQTNFAWSWSVLGLEM